MRKLMLTPRNATQRLQSALGAAIASPVAKTSLAIPLESVAKKATKKKKSRARKK